MGSVTTICSDKTSTLTMNQMENFPIVESRGQEKLQMTVVEAYAGGKKNDPPGNKSELSPKLHSLLIEGVAQNNNGSVSVPEGGNDVEVSGSPTEKAILHWGLEADSEVHIHWKGAAEIVLACYTRYIDANDLLMVSFRKAIEDMAAESLRCVAIAYRTFEKENVPATEEERAHWSLPEDNLVLLAIDPCRPGVKDSVELCQKSGVKVKMVTGDNVKTAKAIAVECGILNSLAEATEPIIIEGKTFRAMTDAQRDEIAEAILVMGSSPNDKLLLVQALRRKGHVVAVTGDGTNDAPALHEADIGLAMGIQGTEVAKESSDIILDGNFASVVKAMYQVSVLLVLNFRSRSILGLTHDKNDHAIKVKNTLIFNAFVLSQIFNEFNARKPDEFNIFSGVTKNYLLCFRSSSSNSSASSLQQSGLIGSSG
ncbi:hypothetical protein Ahy_A07g035289 [Arachis hypogaea]|uniref:Uncharacterized protein n=1 Tax=Arachis hypogaea TaxID=3818 RepID=A0A445CDL8_ARAHY|nr:hypothetical protein Ahy_A07g035289 [Arachis hypogaea]